MFESKGAWFVPINNSEEVNDISREGYEAINKIRNIENEMILKDVDLTQDINSFKQIVDTYAEKLRYAGRTSKESENYQKAIELYSLAQSIETEDQGTSYSLAKVYYLVDNYDKAIEQYFKAYSKGKSVRIKDIHIFFHLGHALLDNKFENKKFFNDEIIRYKKDLKGFFNFSDYHFENSKYFRACINAGEKYIREKINQKKEQDILEKDLLKKIGSSLTDKSVEKELKYYEKQKKELQNKIDWYKKRLKSTEQQIEEFNAEGKISKKKAQKMITKSEHIINDLKKEIQSLTDENSSLKKEKNDYYEKYFNELKKNKELSNTNEKDDIKIIEIEATAAQELYELADNFKICVIGGHEKWQNQIKQCAPQITILRDERFDKNKLRDLDYLIINTEFISHAASNKADNAKDKSATTIFINSNSIKFMVEKIKEELGR